MAGWLRKQTDVKAIEMRSAKRLWVSGVLCISLSGFATAGCGSAQRVAKVPEAGKPAAEGPHAATAKLPQSQQLSTEAKKAADDTEQAANDLLEGIKKDIGGDPYPPSNQFVNINYSDEKRILTLPGINRELAMRIIRNRPYATPTDPMAKHVLTEEEYDRIKNWLTAWDNLWTNPN